MTLNELFQHQSHPRKLRPPVSESDTDHWDTLKKTGFWGRQAAGCVFLAQDTGRFCISHRSRAVLEPGTWGTWGGAIDQIENPAEAVRREVAEETEYTGAMQLIPLLVFRAPTGSFRYYNFLAVVPTEFAPELNWETQGYTWVPWGQWPSPLHPGMQQLLADSASADIMQQSAGKTLAEVTMDNQSGAGSTPNNDDVDYLGLRVRMKPSVFLRLAPPLGHSLSLPRMRDFIQSGGAIGSPQLSLDIPAAWSDGDLAKTARVQSHEGRHRMQAILELEGDAPVETHLFPLGMRRRNLTAAMIQRLQRSLISQGLNRLISGPVFELPQTDLAEHFKQQAKPGSGPGSLRRKAGKKKGEKITASDLERQQSRANRMKQSSDADTRRRGIQLARQVSWHKNFH